MPLKRRTSSGIVSFLMATPGVAMQPGVDESLPPTWVNGVRLEMTRWAGRDIDRRVQLLEAEWRRTSSEIQGWRDVGGWKVLSRRQDRWSESLQVRRSGGIAEIYLSRMDITQRPRSLPQLTTPPGCRANSIVETAERGVTVAQASGPCLGKSIAQAWSWAIRLAAAGWRGGELPGRGVWQFQRGSEQLEVVRAQDWFTSLRTGAQGGAP